MEERYTWADPNFVRRGMSSTLKRLAARASFDEDKMALRTPAVTRCSFRWLATGGAAGAGRGGSVELASALATARHVSGVGSSR